MPKATFSAMVASISTGARRFEWRRLGYLLAMAGAAGATICLLLLASSTAYAAQPTISATSVTAADASEMFAELRDNFLVWSLVLGSVVLLGLVLPFALSGLAVVAGRVALYATAAAVVVSSVALILTTWLIAWASSGAISLARHQRAPRLMRIEAEMREALQLLRGRRIVR